MGEVRSQVKLGSGLGERGGLGAGCGGRGDRKSGSGLGAER